MEKVPTYRRFNAIVEKDKEKASQFFIRIYDIYRFVARYFKALFTRPFEAKEIIRQCYEIGCKSLPIISLTAFITGVVFTKQSRPSLASFGATSWLPGLIAIAIVRALAPLLTALIIAGKVGSNMGAELGSMKVTEQIDAMEVSSTNPFKFLVVTRVTAIMLMLPLLASYFAFIGLYGAYLNVHRNEQSSYILFMHAAFNSLSFLDLFGSIFKALVFGITIGFTGCFQGYNATHGTVGVGRAANAAVVVSMFLVFIEEILIVQVINNFR